MPPNANKIFLQKSLIILLSTGLFFFLVKGVLLALWTISQYGNYDLMPGYEGELAYEKIRLSGGSGDTSVLAKHIIEGREAEKMELIADALYTQGANKEDILLWYERSLLEKTSPRVQAKIDILLSITGSTSGTPGLISTGSSEPNTSSDIMTSGASSPEILEAKARIENDASSRNRYLQKPHNSARIQDTIDYLDQGIERVDW